MSCEEQLRETEDALTDATDKIEQTRVLLRREIRGWRDEGYDWKRIKASAVWEAFILVGGQ